MTFDHLEAPLHEDPLFRVERPGRPPEDRSTWPELARQRAFLSHLRKHAPRVSAFAVPNAAHRGQRAMNQARAEGLRSGAFDLIVGWHRAEATNDRCPAAIAFVEFKGFDASGRPGKLSRAQVEFGNGWWRRGHAVACFFTAEAAIEWLRELGAPVPAKVAA
ncbi:hypothetical protein [Novosphingobium sp.]|uniref:hypothetical protein n=1 Tax=Novosphingobium sp. TaxID=1874826 RepID=UPI002636D406|nr:hypothetical protein [Novosphingobium sp.]